MSGHRKIQSLDCIRLSEALSGHINCQDAVLSQPLGLVPDLMVWAYYRAEDQHLYDLYGAKVQERCIKLLAVAILRLLRAHICFSAVEALQRFGPESYTNDAIDESTVSLLQDWSALTPIDYRVARRARAGPVWAVLQRQALKRWSLVLFAVVAKALWRAFTDHMWRPESGFVRRYMTRRFRAQCDAFQGLSR